MDKQYYVLEELELHYVAPKTAANIYPVLQKTYNVLEVSGDIIDPGKRLHLKKERLIECNREQHCRQDQYGFEQYTVYYSSKSWINLSVSLQVYGSSYERIEYYMFDLFTGKTIGATLFTDPQKVVTLCNKKIKREGSNLRMRKSDLGNIQVDTTYNGSISGISIMIFNDNEVHNRLPQQVVKLDRKEIINYISNRYRDSFR